MIQAKQPSKGECGICNPASGEYDEIEGCPDRAKVSFLPTFLSHTNRYIIMVKVLLTGMQYAPLSLDLWALTHNNPRRQWLHRRPHC